MSLEKYIHQLTRLNTDRARWGKSEATRQQAPHKALLLLAIFEQYVRGDITDGFVEITPELKAQFYFYWNILELPSKTTFALPFFHMKNEGFWRLIPKVNQGMILDTHQTIRSQKLLDQLVIGAKIDDELHDLLIHEEFRQIMISVLLQVYFSYASQVKLLSQIKINVEAYAYSQQLLNQKRNNILEQDTLVYSQDFQRDVLVAYDHRCALSGIRILASNGHTAVRAAYLIPPHVSYDDHPSNGISLSPLCYWAFDEGLITLTNNYQIQTSLQLRSKKNIAGELLALNGRDIILPQNTEYYPKLEYVEYHRKYIFHDT